MNALAQSTLPQMTLIVLTGQDKGVKYQLVAGRAVIGRSSSCDIRVKDDAKISRTHAEIHISSTGVEVVDVSDKNKLIVNNQEVSRQTLQSGDVIQIGETKFKFEVTNPSPTPSLTQVNHPTSFDRPKSRRSRSNSGKKINFYILLIVVIALFGWLLTSKSNKKNVDLRMGNDVQTTIDANNKVLEVIEAEKEKTGLNSRQYQEAQPNFVKGFRDYRKGQYERAIESFQACLSLFPQHVQCKTYLDRSIKRFYELVQYHMISANKYHAQNQYAACMAAYRNVMVMLKNTSDKTYQEAKSGYELCNAKKGEGF